jgi:glyoxylase-like metal-dependent hydrolase (beta-lactamase superfamily II)
MTFGRFDLEFISAPGHSACSLHTVIDDRFVHVADTMLTSNDGDPILPWAERDDLAAHVEALESLRAIADKDLLPGHGVCLSGAGRINREIDLRVRYLQAVAATAPPVPYDDCVGEGDREFLHREWHEVLHGGRA